MRLWHVIIRAIGATSIALSLRGCYLLLDGFQREIVNPVTAPEAPFFREVFFVMNAIDFVFLIGMIVAAIGLLLLSARAVKLYTWLYVILGAYVFAPGLLWTIRGPLGMSIGAAAGIGDIGLGPLMFYPIPFAYPILSVLLANVAARRLWPPDNVWDSSTPVRRKF